MNDSILHKIEVYIQDSIRDFQQSTDGQHINIFDRFIERCQFYYDQPAHSLDEIKLHMNKKLKGDIFEHFCQKYVQICLGLPEVWHLKDTPEAVLTKLNLRRHDLGIDLIARDVKGGYYAIQAKYRKRTTSKQYSALTWKQLSTFHAMVSRSGPYVKHIVITNADYCRQFGRKTAKDKSICYGTLKNIKVSDWMLMAGMSGRTLGDGTRKPEALGDALHARTLGDLGDALHARKPEALGDGTTLPIPKMKAPQIKLRKSKDPEVNTPKLEVGMPTFPVTPPAPPKALVVKKPTFKSSVEDLRIKRTAFLDKLETKIV